MCPFVNVITFDWFTAVLKYLNVSHLSEEFIDHLCVRLSTLGYQRGINTGALHSSAFNMSCVLNMLCE